MLLSSRVVLAEDHPGVRAAVTHLLSEHCTVIQTLDRGDAVLSVVDRERPDAVVLDISLPGLNGFQALSALRSTFPSLAIVLISSHVAEVYRMAALHRGADGFVSKEDAVTQLWATVRAAVELRKTSGGTAVPIESDAVESYA